MYILACVHVYTCEKRPRVRQPDRVDIRKHHRPIRGQHLTQVGGAAARNDVIPIMI